jgi:hypothetical protein
MSFRGRHAVVDLLQLTVPARPMNLAERLVADLHSEWIPSEETKKPDSSLNRAFELDQRC